VFIENGPGSQKIAAGWRPGMFGLYPAPTVAEIRRRIAEGSGDPAAKPTP
jgi:hypothetical protein